MLLRYTEIIIKWCRGKNLEECNHDYSRYYHNTHLKKLGKTIKKSNSIQPRVGVTAVYDLKMARYYHGGWGEGVGECREGT
jgi:hypothetical protein